MVELYVIFLDQICKKLSVFDGFEGVGSEIEGRTAGSLKKCLEGGEIE